MTDVAGIRVRLPSTNQFYVQRTITHMDISWKCEILHKKTFNLSVLCFSTSFNALTRCILYLYHKLEANILPSYLQFGDYV